MAFEERYNNESLGVGSVGWMNELNSSKLDFTQVASDEVD